MGQWILDDIAKKHMYYSTTLASPLEWIDGVVDTVKIPTRLAGTWPWADFKKDVLDSVKWREEVMFRLGHTRPTLLAGLQARYTITPTEAKLELRIQNVYALVTFTLNRTTGEIGLTSRAAETVPWTAFYWISECVERFIYLVGAIS